MLSMRLLSENFRHGYLLAALLLLVVARPFVAPAGGTFGLIDHWLRTDGEFRTLEDGQEVR